MLNDLERSPLLTIDNLTRTLLIAGALILAGLIASNPTSWLTKGAAVAFLWGFISFMLTSQFLVAIDMQESNPETSLSERARSPRLALPFLSGVMAYFLAAVLMSIHFLLS